MNLFIYFVFLACVCFNFHLTRAAMTSIQQLRGDLTSTGDQPSTNLATYFKVGLQCCHLNKMACETTCNELNVSYYLISVFFVIRIAPWTQRRTSWSVWRHLERCSAIDLVRQSAHTVWHSASRYEVKKMMSNNGSVTHVMTFLSDLYFSSLFQRFNLGVKLYYKVMEAMLKSVLL